VGGEGGRIAAQINSARDSELDDNVAEAAAGAPSACADIIAQKGEDETPAGTPPPQSRALRLSAVYGTFGMQRLIFSAKYRLLVRGGCSGPKIRPGIRIRAQKQAESSG
jgi:hypothetical protein